MSLRVKMAHSILHLGAFVQSMAIMVMKPDDLVEFSRQTYSKNQNVDSWAEDSLVDSGLNPEELELLEAIPAKNGHLLLLGVGGGREAIPLARQGFQVVGVDYVNALVERAIRNATRRGVRIEGLVQEISMLDVPAESFDVIWISRELYSCVPTRQRRVKMLKAIRVALKPSGYLVCQFRLDPRVQAASGRGLLIRRLTAALTLGNLSYEIGDGLWQNVEFLHSFPTLEAMRSELEQAGLDVLSISTALSRVRGSVICQKPSTPGKPANLETVQGN